MIGTLVGEHALERRQDSRGRLEQRLARQHQVEVVIGMDVERLQHLVQHRAMLRRDAHFDIEAGGCSRRLRITGQSLIASGRVPKIRRILRMLKSTPRSRGAWSGVVYLCR